MIDHACKRWFRDLRYLSRAMTSEVVPATLTTDRPHPGTSLADATEWLDRQDLWRGRPGCRHRYTNSAGTATDYKG